MRRDGLRQQLAAARGGQPAGGVERAEQQRVGAGGLDECDRAVDHVAVDPPACAQVDHGRLGQRADDLVGARDDEVGAQRQRVRGQILVEGQVRAPRLVDHERNAVGVGHLGQAGHVGHRAEVGGRDGGGPHRVGRIGQRPVERLGRQAVGDAAARGRPRGRRSSASARRGCSRRPCSSARCAARPRGRRRGRARAARRGCPGRRRCPGTRCARRPRPRPPAAWACWNGVGLGRPMSMPQVSAGMSSASAFSPMASRSSGSAAGAALVAGHVQALGVAAPRRRSGPPGTGLATGRLTRPSRISRRCVARGGNRCALDRLLGTRPLVASSG